jgi:hypothetical protein
LAYGGSHDSESCVYKCLLRFESQHLFTHKKGVARLELDLVFDSNKASIPASFVDEKVVALPFDYSRVTARHVAIMREDHISFGSAYQRYRTIELVALSNLAAVGDQVKCGPPPRVTL